MESVRKKSYHKRDERPGHRHVPFVGQSSNANQEQSCSNNLMKKNSIILQKRFSLKDYTYFEWSCFPFSIVLQKVAAYRITNVLSFHYCLMLHKRCRLMFFVLLICKSLYVTLKKISRLHLMHFDDLKK